MADAVDLLTALSALEKQLLEERHDSKPLLPHQKPPEGDWVYWVIMAGRGSGKTYGGARWLND